MLITIIIKAVFSEHGLGITGGLYYHVIIHSELSEQDGIITEFINDRGNDVISLCGGKRLLELFESI